MAVNLVKSRNQKTNRALTAEWSTPQWLFDELDKEFHFTLDACAQPFNAKCKKFYSPKENGLEQSWKGETVFCCPPSGVKELRHWVEKASSEAKKKGTTVVMLLPVSTDSRWFKDNIYHQNGVVVRFLPGRIKFVNPIVPSWVNGNNEDEAHPVAGGMRPSMVVIFTGKKAKFCVE